MWIRPEPRTEAVEQFLAMLRFEQRRTLAELPIDLKKWFGMTAFSDPHEVSAGVVLDN